MRNPKKTPFVFLEAGLFFEFSRGRQKTFRDLFVRIRSCLSSMFHFLVHLPYLSNINEGRNEERAASS